MEIIEEINDNKFKVEVNPSSTSLSLEVDGDSKSSSQCSGLQSKEDSQQVVSGRPSQYLSSQVTMKSNTSYTVDRN